MTVLEDLYYGNIVPQERSYRLGSPQKQRQEAVSELESSSTRSSTSSVCGCFAPS